MYVLLMQWNSGYSVLAFGSLLAFLVGGKGGGGGGGSDRLLLLFSSLRTIKVIVYLHCLSPPTTPAILSQKKRLLRRFRIKKVAHFSLKNFILLLVRAI